MSPAPLPEPRASLARSTLLKMGVRIALVIALTTFVSYLHIFRSMRDEALVQLERHVSERTQREQAIFVLAQDNHAVLNKALAERIQHWRQQDPTARFTDTYVMLPEGADVVYWPEGPTWCQDAASDFQITSFDYFTSTLPENNPRRQTVWTGIFEDEPSRKWMVSVTTPLDVEGRHVATAGHDVLLDELMARTANDSIPGTYNVLFRDDGQLVAHPELKLESGKGAYDILGAGAPGSVTQGFDTPEQRAHLRSIFERVKGRTAGQSVLELPEYGEYLAMAWGGWRTASSSWRTRSTGERRPCGRPTRGWSSGWSSAPGSCGRFTRSWWIRRGGPAWRRSPPTSCTTWATCSPASTPR